MNLSIITINRNNAAGLKKTMNSVAIQNCKDFEYIVVDGDSSDGSVEVIRELESSFGDKLKWVSEPDKGIYNAMNKGIKMASGDYLQFLNSGDCLASENVICQMFEALISNGSPTILYGNMLKDIKGGGLRRDRSFAGKEISFLGLYIGSLNHSPAYIRKSLFNRYGLYDEQLRIVSDWKWFLQAIIMGGEKPVYADIDVSLFDMNGISETNKTLEKAERKKVLNDLFPSAVLTDYNRWALPINRLRRLERHPWANRVVWLLERSLFRMEKSRNRRSGENEY